MKYLKIAIVLTVAMAFCASMAPADENHELWSPSTYVQSAKIHYRHVYLTGGKKRDDLYHCIDLLKEGANRFGRVPEFYYMLGTFYNEINAIDTVIMYFDSVTAMCDDESIDQKFRKNCYKGDKYIQKMADQRQDIWEKSYNSAVNFVSQYDQISDMKKASDLPEESDSAKVLDSMMQAAFDVAMSDFHQANLAKPNNPKTIEGIAVLLQREERHAEAIEYYKQAMEMEGGEDKADSALISKIAYAYIYIPDWEKSVEWFEKVIARSPNDINAMVNLSVSYSNLDQKEKWYEYTQKILELQPDNTQFLFNAGQYWFVKMQDAAVAMSEIKDDDANRKAERAALDAEAKSCMNKAAGYFEKISDIDPNDTDALRQLGVLNLLGQDPQGAIDAFNKYIAVNPNDNEILEFLGRAYILNGDSKGAIKPYEMITENDPGNTNAWERLGELYEYNDMAEKSKEAKARAEELKKL